MEGMSRSHLEVSFVVEKSQGRRSSLPSRNIRAGSYRSVSDYACFNTIRTVHLVDHLASNLMQRGLLRLLLLSNGWPSWHVRVLFIELRFELSPVDAKVLLPLV
mmetsp:Transcript_3911/g.5911  ORF Transcript_3911/g.5911 Transcript_3911/m.5911 type:complete len:104 (-) Transcript_3911:810-1121(-)